MLDVENIIISGGSCTAWPQQFSPSYTRVMLANTSSGKGTFLGFRIVLISKSIANSVG